MYQFLKSAMQKKQINEEDEETMDFRTLFIVQPKRPLAEDACGNEPCEL